MDPYAALLQGLVQDPHDRKPHLASLLFNKLNPLSYQPLQPIDPHTPHHHI
jgi:hypothetical protein